MGTRIYCYLAVESSVNSNMSERKFDSLPLLGLDPVTFSIPMHRSDHTTKSHVGPKRIDSTIYQSLVSQQRDGQNANTRHKTLWLHNQIIKPALRERWLKSDHRTRVLLLLLLFCFLFLLTFSPLPRSCYGWCLVLALKCALVVYTQYGRSLLTTSLAALGYWKQNNVN
jgi:hypothetical protein